MATSPENRRAGREEELRKKAKEAIKRYEDVFAKPLSTALLKEFLDWSEQQTRLTFLRDRLGVLSDTDVRYLRNFLKENGAVDEDPSDLVDPPSVDDIDLPDLV